MTGKLIRVISAPVKWITGESQLYCDAVAAIILQGGLRGYSWGNLFWLSKQVAHETAWGTSNSMELDANAFGMNCVQIRETTQTGCRETSTGEVLGVYPSVWRSVRDRYLWDNYWDIADYRKSSQYPTEVGRYYHTSSGYINQVTAVDESRIKRVMWLTAVMLPVELMAVKAFLR